MISSAKIAKLANLPLENLGNLGDLEGKLAATLDFVEVLKEVETDGVAPTSQIGNNENRMREDKVTPDRIIPANKYKSKIVWE